MKKRDSYTVTEVGTLIKAFETKISVIAEGVAGLLSWKEVVNTRLESIDNRLMLVEDVVKVAIPDIYRRVKHLEAKIA